MPLRMIRPFSPTRAFGLFTMALAFMTCGIYLVFDFYLSSVGEEIVGSWLQSETVAIQEGNLLSTITKNQRVLMSSQFVKGVVLFDTSVTPPRRLIEFGSIIPEIKPSDYRPGEVEVLDSGFLDKKTLFRVKHRPELLLVFDIYSNFLVKAFAGAIATFVLFLVVLFASIKRVEQKEFKKRADFIKKAITDLVESEKPSPFIQKEFPFLAEWWNSKKLEIETARRTTVENESKILFGEMAARVAHDIRSPINTLNVVSESISEMPPATQILLQTAIQRIREVASSLVDYNRRISSVLSDTPDTGPHLLFFVIEELVQEKRTQYAARLIEFEFRSTLEETLFAKFNISELKRTLSNLIDNAVEAISDAGHVKIEIGASDGLTKILVSDSGKGIPSASMARIGEKGFSSGKAGGSGLGLFYAKQNALAWGGDFALTSIEGAGTKVNLSIPLVDPPDWYASALVLAADAKLIVLDDDPSIHALWRTRIAETIGPEVTIEHFFDAKSALAWASENRGGLGKCYLLSDHDLKESGDTGLDVVERIGISPSQVLLVTGAFGQGAVQARCQKLNIKLLPKPLIASIPIVRNTLLLSIAHS